MPTPHSTNNDGLSPQVRYQRLVRAKREKAGLCLGCGVALKDTPFRTCADCRVKERERNKRRRAADPKAGYERTRRWMLTPEGRAKTLAKVRKYQKTEKGKAQRERYKVKLKYEVMSAYSGGGVPRCVCCGEQEMAFLTLDHVNNDRCKLQKRGYGGTRWYKWLRLRGYPNDPQLETSCFNCNCGKRSNGGVCPHKTKAQRGEAAHEARVHESSVVGEPR